MAAGSPWHLLAVLLMTPLFLPAGFGDTSRSDLEWPPAIPPVVEVPPGPGIRAWIESPSHVIGGHPFSALGHVELTGLGTNVVQVVPAVAPGPCSLVDFYVSGGVPLGANTWLLSDQVGLAPLLDPSDPYEVADHLDITIELDTAEGSLGVCKPGFVATEIADPLRSAPLQALVDIVPPVPLPIELGAIQTSGGNDAPDQAKVVVPASPRKLIVPVYTATPQVALLAKAQHLELSATIKDRGTFEIRQDGAALERHTLSRHGQIEIMDYIADIPHAAGQTVTTRFCFYGVYQDAGVWTDWEGEAETCMVVEAVEPSIDAISGPLVNVIHSLVGDPQLEDEAAALLDDAPSVWQLVHEVDRLLDRYDVRQAVQLAVRGEIIRSLHTVDQYLAQACTTTGWRSAQDDGAPPSTPRAGSTSLSPPEASNPAMKTVAFALDSNMDILCDG